MLKAIARQSATDQQARTGKWLSAIGLVLSLVLGAILAIYAASRPEIGFYPSIALFLVALILCVLIAQYLFDLEGWFDQRRRDLTAQHIFQTLRKGNPGPPFILYLRPFHSTDQISESKAVAINVRMTPGGPNFLAATSDRLEFEDVIENALSPIGPMVALGEPLEHLGAGRIKVPDREWKLAIQLLIDHARLIILLPSPRPGTQWEVLRLLSTPAIEKTIIIDPPNHKGARSETYDPQQEWQGIRQAFEARQYDLPEDSETGQLFWFGRSKSPRLRTDLILDGDSQLKKFAAQVLNQISANTPNIASGKGDTG